MRLLLEARRESLLTSKFRLWMPAKVFRLLRDISPRHIDVSKIYSGERVRAVLLQRFQKILLRIAQSARIISTNPRSLYALDLSPGCVAVAATEKSLDASSKFLAYTFVMPEKICALGRAISVKYPDCPASIEFVFLNSARAPSESVDTWPAMVLSENVFRRLTPLKK